MTCVSKLRIFNRRALQRPMSCSTWRCVECVHVAACSCINSSRQRQAADDGWLNSSILFSPGTIRTAFKSITGGVAKTTEVGVASYGHGLSITAFLDPGVHGYSTPNFLFKGRCGAPLARTPLLVHGVPYRNQLLAACTKRLHYDFAVVLRHVVQYIDIDCLLQCRAHRGFAAST